MSKTWNGPIPYDSNKLYNRVSYLRIQGYRAAMNSPEVRAMYEALQQMRVHGHGGGCSACNARLAVAAYEAGLREE